FPHIQSYPAFHGHFFPSAFVFLSFGSSHVVAGKGRERGRTMDEIGTISIGLVCIVSRGRHVGDDDGSWLAFRHHRLSAGGISGGRSLPAPRKKTTSGTCAEFGSVSSRISSS